MDDPFIFTLVLKAVPEAIKEARDLVGFAFGHWGLEDYVARTVASELVTNAVVHGSRDGQYVVARTYLLDGGLPVIEVWDQSGDVPVVQVAGADDEGGRGLFLMEQLVVRWGVRPLNEGGKVVFALVEPVGA